MLNKIMIDLPGFKGMMGDLAMGRFAEPQEVPDTAAFWSSNASSYINGHTLVVDTGLMFPNRRFRGLVLARLRTRGKNRRWQLGQIWGKWRDTLSNKYTPKRV